MNQLCVPTRVTRDQTTSRMLLRKRNVPEKSENNTVMCSKQSQWAPLEITIYTFSVSWLDILCTHAGADPGFWNGGWIFVIMWSKKKNNNVIEPKPGWGVWGLCISMIQKKKGGAGENSPISPPLDPRLSCNTLLTLFYETLYDGLNYAWDLNPDLPRSGVK